MSGDAFEGPLRASPSPLRIVKADASCKRVPLSALKDREADLERSAATLTNHTERAVAAMAIEIKASRETEASMLSSMAEAHRRAAERLDRAALRMRLSMKGGAR